MDDATGAPRIIILGCGFGGLSAAKAFAGARVTVTVIDRANHHMFQPLLYQVATAGPSAPARGPVLVLVGAGDLLRVQRGCLVPGDARPGVGAEFFPSRCQLGERYFHITDPDGHELSFAKPASTR